MVIYDHWPYMTMFGILEVVFIALRKGIQIDRLLLKEQVMLQENCLLAVHLQMVVQGLVFVLDIMLE